ncbi:MAG: hypothetical protein H0W47_18075 [Polaromonas sp.]|uniref:DUF2946 family protein n=1 Tax=Polaromonas sp. TaxID=1869339 RepID=UPI001841FB45|nr:DUF2946 family protein [Polaromonas sp.]MBA3595673.1 hypothetical protein [Polaromonas sp.]
MPHHPSSRPLWARLAAWLGFVAVFAALLAPVSVLAEEVRTGKLGGLCNAGKALNQSTDDASLPASHCELCGSAGPGLLSSPCSAVFPVGVTAMALVAPDPVRPALSPGLPFSRGPPVR